jgi:phosphatidylglycerophosphate synthase
MILPGVEAGPLTVIIAVAVLIAGNTVVSELFARREISWNSAAKQFVAMTAVNLLLFFVWNALWSGDETPLPIAVTLFSVGLITLLTVLFDRYREAGATHRSENAVVTE